jgi:hypothetical protein
MIDDLLQTLTPPQRAAVDAVRLALDIHNRADGAGLFRGVERYAILGARVEVCAVQANSMLRFWALLHRRLNWPTPPRAWDADVAALMAAPDGAEVLRTLATETVSIVTLARIAHDAGKAQRRAQREAPPMPDDDLDDAPKGGTENA